MAIKKEDIINAIKDSSGLVSVIAKRLGCSRKHVYSLMEKWPEVLEARDDERELLKDYAEAYLIKHLHAGQEWAIKYVLSRLARDRGFGDKLEVGGLDGGPIPIMYVEAKEQKPKKKARKKPTKKK